MNLLKISVLVLSFSFAFLTAVAFSNNNNISKENYKIYATKSNGMVNISNIVDYAKDYDVILFGEEHNDAVGHYIEKLLLQQLYKKYGDNLTLSMEMFDRDAQIVLDEYLSGKIKEYYFKKDARVWNNYTDYRPLVEFAKKKHIDVIAANAPFRYVDMANRKGQESLETLSEIAKTFIAPLPYDTATGAYLKKLNDLMARMRAAQTKKNIKKTEMKKTKKMAKIKMPHIDINLGQSLWNATMAYSISQYLNKNPDKKIFHINGRMHSDEHFGVAEQLEKYKKGTRVMVISAFPDSSFKNPDFNKFKKLGDFVIITDPEVSKTFEE